MCEPEDGAVGYILSWLQGWSVGLADGTCNGSHEQSACEFGANPIRIEFLDTQLVLKNQLVFSSLHTFVFRSGVRKKGTMVIT